MWGPLTACGAATQALEYLRVNNVYCLISPSHASIWAQANDAGVNASFKSLFGQAVRAWRTPGCAKMLRSALARA